MGCFLYDRDLRQERVKRERGLQGSFFVMQRLCNKTKPIITQWVITCSKLTIETLGQRVKYVQS